MHVVAKPGTFVSCEMLYNAFLALSHTISWLKQILIFVIKCRGSYPRIYFAPKLTVNIVKSTVWTYFDILEDENT